jgi:ubiquinone/menaquinone biosynthesis C-methylase UbiE
MDELRPQCAPGAFPPNDRPSYVTEEVIDFYSGYDKIQAPEARIIEILEPHMKSMRMIDIGIGAGRTTALFAHRVRSYVGIDYSHSMVDVARQRFAWAKPPLDLRWGDAAHLNSFASGVFDFVLFSFNGLDYLPLSLRQDALNEMFRVLAKEGIMCFSSHNSRNIPRLLRLRMHRNPCVLARRVMAFFKVRWHNRDALRRCDDDVLVLRDGDLNFEAAYVYVRPAYQVRKLLSMGIRSVRCFALSDGREIPHCELDGETGAWVYYLCEK